MAGARRCEEIIRAIDEVLASCDEAVSSERPSRGSASLEGNVAELAWAGLVRWGAVPSPLATVCARRQGPRAS